MVVFLAMAHHRRCPVANYTACWQRYMGVVQAQVDLDRFRNISNLDLVEPNWIRDPIYACIRLLFDVENVAYMHLLFDNIRYSPDASGNVNYFLFFVPDVKCGLYEETKTTEQMLHMDRVRSKKCSETEPKRCWTEEVQDQDLDHVLTLAVNNLPKVIIVQHCTLRGQPSVTLLISTLERNRLLLWFWCWTEHQADYYTVSLFTVNVSLVSDVDQSVCTARHFLLSRVWSIHEFTHYHIW